MGACIFEFFTVDQVETQEFGIPPSPLKFGWGYVQFCLFDDNFPIPPENPELGTPFSNNGFHFGALTKSKEVDPRPRPMRNASCT